MKKLPKILLTLALASTLPVMTAVCDVFSNEVWDLNESTTILLHPQPGFGGVVGYANGSLLLDPISGVVTWHYGWGATNLAGDVEFIDTGNSQVSDLLRFDGVGGVYIFSQVGGGDPADVGIPQAFSPVILPELNNVVVISVPSLGTNNATLYAPGPGMPGYDTSGILPNLEFTLTSDVVPEPSTIGLVVVGLLGALGIRRRKA